MAKSMSPLARRRMRVRSKLKRVQRGRLRLSVFRSGSNIYAQVIDDTKGVTVAAASTLDKEASLRGKSNVDSAAQVGKMIAERAKAAGVEDVYFDRSGYLFHGRVKALADSAREAGLKF
jgi:large subunit ribosomal protein L18